MAKLLFGNRIAPACRYCVYVRQQENGLVCQKKKAVEADGQCSRFRYDPLKREPKVLQELPTYSEEEFSL